MKDINQFLARWEAIKAKGKKKYVLSRGLLGWGFPYLIIWNGLFAWYTLSEAAIKAEAGVPYDALLRNLMIISIVNFLLAVAFGLYMGNWLWKMRTNKYEFFKNTQPNRITTPWHPDFNKPAQKATHEDEQE